MSMRLETKKRIKGNDQVEGTSMVDVEETKVVEEEEVKVQMLRLLQAFHTEPHSSRSFSKSSAHQDYSGIYIQSL